MRSTGVFLRARGALAFRSALEPLEQRTCLSVTVTTNDLDDGTELVITGNGADDEINILDDGAGGVEVTGEGGLDLGSFDDVIRIRLNSGGGNDIVNYTLSGPLGVATSHSFNLGSGDDEANFDYSAGLEADLRLSVNGNGGDDLVDVGFGNLTDARLRVTLDGGDGNDEIALHTDGDGDEFLADEGSSVRANIDGGNGDDTIDVDLAGVGAAKLNLDVDGGDGEDDISVTATGGGESESDFRLDVDGGDENDVIVVALNAVSAERLRLDLEGGRGDDDLSLLASDAALAANASAHITLSGEAGNDTLMAVLNGTFLGNLHLRADGGLGSDMVVSEITADEGSSGRVFGQVTGGLGVDDVTFNVFDESAAPGEESLLAGVHAMILNPLASDTLTHTDNVKVVPKQNGNGNGPGGSPPVNGGGNGNGGANDNAVTTFIQNLIERLMRFLRRFQ